VPEGTGHIVSDIDHFLRLKKLNLIPKNSLYIFIGENKTLSPGFLSIYKEHFFYSCSSSFLYNITFPLLLAYPDLTLDVGLSRLKKIITYKNLKGTKLTLVNLQITKKDGYQQWLKYLSLRSRSANYLPMIRGRFSSTDLDDFLDLRGRPLALIHIKNSVVNATAKETDTVTYIPSLIFLKSKGYKLVKFGTEEMPDSFNKLGVVNYPISSLHSFENDLKLIHRSSISIVAGSGVGWLSDVMNKPLVYLNYWHLPTPPYSKNCILVPTLVKKKKGRFLSFKEQSDLYINSKDIGGEYFPAKLYTARNASDDEILAAVRECIAISKKKNIKLNSLQLRYRELDSQGYSAYIESRISAYFVNVHKDLLN
jgi:putative glycosyltransferase (TIGR04372 family)